MNPLDLLNQEDKIVDLSKQIVELQQMQIQAREKYQQLVAGYKARYDLSHDQFEIVIGHIRATRTAIAEARENAES